LVPISLVARSSNPSVLEIVASQDRSFCCDGNGRCSQLEHCAANHSTWHQYSFDVQARAEGEARLEVYHDGVLYDAVTLRARPATRLVVEHMPQRRPWTFSAGSPIRVRMDEQMNIRARSFDANGQPLHALRGIEITVGDPAIVDLPGSTTHRYMFLHSRGSTWIAATAGSLTARADVVVE
jgi:hypothetical protein